MTRGKPQTKVLINAKGKAQDSSVKVKKKIVTDLRPGDTQMISDASRKTKKALSPKPKQQTPHHEATKPIHAPVGSPKPKGGVQQQAVHAEGTKSAIQATEPSLKLQKKWSKIHIKKAPSRIDEGGPEETPVLARKTLFQDENDVNVTEENEVSGAMSESVLFCTPREIMRPICGARAILQVTEGMVTLEEPVIGDFGVVHCKLSFFAPNERFTMKFEKRSNRFRRLKMELTVFLKAQATENRRFFPYVHARGVLSDSHLFFVVDLIGHNLTVQRVLAGGRFKLETAYRLALSTLTCILTLHELGFVHRDIKPNVFTISNFPNANRIILSSVGLSKEAPGDRDSWKPRKYVPFLGTTTYCSRANHNHQDQVFIDDIESWLYMVCEWIEPEMLSWAHIYGRQDVLIAKENFMSPEKGFKEHLGLFPSLPPEFKDIVHYIHSLKGEFIVPQKAFLVEIIAKVQKRLKLREDAPFQWCREA
ncbi:hypothetical protein L596_013092 [Steinernema carpocapsae]|uniref:Protein kinase domain-containing protein n=1 Tax=Steinernema carpocapsae TaxID=34508 RepID=A0A4U5NZM4_STECR|nr:hypothetical protein L596_013092 [Steinernema carpocapsae]